MRNIWQRPNFHTTFILSVAVRFCQCFHNSSNVSNRSSGNVETYKIQPVGGCNLINFGLRLGCIAFEGKLAAILFQSDAARHGAGEAVSAWRIKTPSLACVCNTGIRRARIVACSSYSEIHLVSVACCSNRWCFSCFSHTSTNFQLCLLAQWNKLSLILSWNC